MWLLPSSFEHSYPHVFANIMLLRLGDVDDFVARLSLSRELSNSAAYEFIRGGSEKRVRNSLVWRHFIPPSGSFLFWRLMHGRLPTKKALQKRRVVIALV